ncbi:MAG TPA: dTDP-4-dehydrorhamnose 3,5-epimerase [Actinobacteria bacterium]|nr:dTDP-4-dehydrorhamnose 3,5-epimerase [Actinomycetota bacterium]
MRVLTTSLPGVVVLEPRVYEDERGSFTEVWNRREFTEAVGGFGDFVQDNESTSRRGVLRGIHYQLPPAAQGKLVRVVVGEVFDVAVDLRRSSPSFGRWFGIRLSADDRRQLWIPPGFGHGFLSLVEGTVLSYKVTHYYDPARERRIRWDDPQLAIEWPLEGDLPLLSHQDANAPPLAAAEVFE